MLSSRRTALLGALLALVVAGCGSDEGGAASGGPDPASVMPASAAMYAEAVIQPGGDQGDAVRSLLGTVLRTDDPGAKVKALIDEELAKEQPGLTFDEDIDPWLGDRVAVALTNLAADEPSYTVAIAVEDAGEASAFVAAQAKRENGAARAYGGEDFFVDDEGAAVGVVEDFVVVTASEADFKRAADTAKGEGLDDAERFEEAVDDLPEERLGLFFLDPRSIADAAAASAGDPSAAAVVDGAFDGIGVMTAFAQAAEDHATIESRTALTGEGTGATLAGLAAGSAPELLRSLPENAWAAFAVGGVGETVDAALDTVAGGLGRGVVVAQLREQTGLDLDRDLLAWIDDVAVFARGESMADLGGAVVIAATGSDEAAAALPKIVGALRTRGGVPFDAVRLAGADQAWSASVPGAPGPVVLARKGDRVVLALGEKAATAALDPQGTLGDSGRYDRAEDALEGMDPSFVLDAPAAIKLLAEGAAGDEDFAKAKPYLDVLDLLAAGLEGDDDAVTQRFVVKVK